MWRGVQLEETTSVLASIWRDNVRGSEWMQIEKGHEMTAFDGVLEDDYAPPTRSLLPTVLSLIALIAVVAALVWWKQRN